MTGAVVAATAMDAGAYIVALSNQSVINSGAGTRTATFELNADGRALKNGSTPVANEWTSPQKSGVASLYEARATMTIGTVTSGTVGSWVSISTSPAWAKTDTTAGDGPQECQFTLEIRDAGTLTVLDSATITLSAERTS